MIKRCGLVVLGLLALACNSGGGGGGGGGGSMTAPMAVSFTAAGASGTNSVFLASSGSVDGARFTLEVRVSGVTDLYGVGLDLQFPRDLVRYEGADTVEGSFLSAGGTVPTELLIRNNPQGNLVIGHTRLGESPGVDGSDLLFSLDFTTRASGNGTFTITDGELFGSDGLRQDGVAFVAGSVLINI